VRGIKYTSQSATSALASVASSLSLLSPLILSALLGAGIQRTDQLSALRRWQRIAQGFTYALVLLGLTALYVLLFGDMAVQPARGRQATNALIRIITGAPSNINATRVFLFGMMGVMLGLFAIIGLHSGVRNGGWLRERVDRLRSPHHLTHSALRYNLHRIKYVRRNRRIKCQVFDF